MPGLSAKAELLLSLAQSRRDTVDGSSYVPAEALDLDHVLEWGRPHGLLPLLYWHLAAAGRGSISDEALSRLRDHFETNARRNLRLAGELRRLLSLLDARGIVAVPFKGPLLSASIYGSLALRQFNDLDILVRREDVWAARELLISHGYCAQFDPPLARRAVVLGSHCESFVRADRAIVVELHWRFAPDFFSFRLGLEELQERLDWTTFCGARVRSLSPEDLLLVLCVHGAKHCWERLEWICDVAEVLRAHPRLDWQRLTERARRLGSLRMLSLGLLLAARLLHAPVPDEIMRRALADRSAAALAARVQEQLFVEPHSPPGLVVCARERLVDKARYWALFVFAPTVGDLTFLSLPRPLFFLYYVLRPIRIATKYLLRLLRRAARL